MVLLNSGRPMQCSVQNPQTQNYTANMWGPLLARRCASVHIWQAQGALPVIQPISLCLGLSGTSKVPSMREGGWSEGG